MKTTASTVEEYFAGLSEERRAVVSVVREVILRHLPAGYQERPAWGGICYEVPLDQYPHTYNGQPLAYVALTAQKNHFALYVMSLYDCSGDHGELRDAFARAGKRLDMGKACIRFRKLDDLPLDVIGALIASTAPDTYVARCEAARRR